MKFLKIYALLIVVFGIIGFFVEDESENNVSTKAQEAEVLPKSELKANEAHIDADTVDCPEMPNLRPNECTLLCRDTIKFDCEYLILPNGDKVVQPMRIIRSEISDEVVGCKRKKDLDQITQLFHYSPEAMARFLDGHLRTGNCTVIPDGYLVLVLQKDTLSEIAISKIHRISLPGKYWIPSDFLKTIADAY